MEWGPDGDMTPLLPRLALALLPLLGGCRTAREEPVMETMPVNGTLEEILKDRSLLERYLAAQKIQVTRAREVRTYIEDTVKREFLAEPRRTDFRYDTHCLLPKILETPNTIMNPLQGTVRRSGFDYPRSGYIAPPRCFISFNADRYTNSSINNERIYYERRIAVDNRWEESIVQAGMSSDWKDQFIYSADSQGNKRITLSVS